MKRCYAYIRVSGPAQVEGDGFPRQREEIQSFAAANRCEIVGEYAEEGVSGTKEADTRPAWAQMLRAMESGPVKTVIVERIDRLARDLMVSEVAIADLQKRGLEIISTAEPDLCSSDPTRVLIRQIMGALSQYDRSLIVRKLRVARDRCRAAKGRCEGQKPFGFYEAEKPVLAEILRRRDQRFLSAKRIAEELNVEGVPNRKGTKWHPYVVSHILRANGAVI
jgi:DNA invertase Pin-like site-specific DNA recombinase